MKRQPIDWNLIWHATVDDGTWHAQVTRTGDREGRLTVTLIDGGEVILDETVSLGFGAIWGPDVDDVAMWKVMVIEAIDHYNAQSA